MARTAAQAAFERALDEDGDSRIEQSDLDAAIDSTRASVSPEDAAAFQADIERYARS